VSWDRRGGSKVSWKNSAWKFWNSKLTAAATRFFHGSLFNNMLSIKNNTTYLSQEELMFTLCSYLCGYIISALRTG
jgi:hypothetical protein